MIIELHIILGDYPSLYNQEYNSGIGGVSKETGLKLSEYGEIVEYNSEQSAISNTNSPIKVNCLFISIDNDLKYYNNEVDYQLCCRNGAIYHYVATRVHLTNGGSFECGIIVRYTNLLGSYYQYNNLWYIDGSNQNLALRPMVEIDNLQIDENGKTGLDYDNPWHIVR